MKNVKSRQIYRRRGGIYESDLKAENAAWRRDGHGKMRPGSMHNPIIIRTRFWSGFCYTINTRGTPKIVFGIY